tara:strand:- start:1268 stop:2260 length:993 start_codon:yes stop_codon:yes gene_type:complete
VSEQSLSPNNGTSQLLISGDDIPFGAYQAIYHKITRKVESRTKKYPDAYRVTKSDLKNMHERLVQAVQPYDVKSSRCQLTHALKDDTSKDHSSFEKFFMSDCSTRSSTVQLNYEFDFLIILPPEVPEAKEIVQKFTTKVVIDQISIDNDDSDAPYFIRGLNIGGSLTVKMEFSDYAVSQHLMATLDGWVESLPTKKEGKFLKSLFKYERSIRSIVPPTARFLTMLAGAFYLFDVSDLRSGLVVLALSFGLSAFLESVSYMFLNSFFQKLPQMKPTTRLLITQGDSDSSDEMDDKKNLVLATLSFLFFGVAMTLFLGSLSSGIYAYITDKI